MLRGLLALLVLPALSALAQTPDNVLHHWYIHCVSFSTAKVPKGRESETPWPRDLDVEEKRYIVNCANGSGDVSFSDWLRRQLANDPDVKEGRVVMPLDQRPPTATKSPDELIFHDLLYKMAASLIVIVIAFRIVSGRHFGIGPFFFAVSGLACFALAQYGSTIGRGKGNFDEMGGMTAAFATMLGYLLLMIATIWAVIRFARRNAVEDD